MPQLELPLQHEPERSDWGSCNDFRESLKFIFHLLDLVRGLNPEVFYYSGIGNLTYDEIHDLLLEVVIMGAVVGTGGQPNPSDSENHIP